MSDNTMINWIEYLVKDSDLSSIIEQYYALALQNNSILSLQTVKDITTPVSGLQQKEHTCRSNIMPYLLSTGLEVKSPLLENMVYDLILGELKVQEKLSGGRKSDKRGDCKGLEINLTKLEGNKLIPYHENDFGILLIHNPPPYERTIYFIPTDKLKEHEFVAGEGVVGKESLCMIVDEAEVTVTIRNWTSEFLFYYDDPNLKERLLTVYYNQLYHRKEPIVLIDPVFWDTKCRTLHLLFSKWNIPITFPVKDLVYKYILYNKKLQELRILNKDKRKSMSLFYGKDNKKKCLYKPADFDFAYCRIDNLFYFIPMDEFTLRNIINDEKSQVSITLPKYIEGTLTGRHKWMNDFMFDFDDDNFYNKFHTFMTKYIPELISIKR